MAKDGLHSAGARLQWSFVVVFKRALNSDAFESEQDIVFLQKLAYTRGHWGWQAYFCRD
jgi:hypothetical protein